MTIHVLATGGTILQRAVAGRMAIAADPLALLRRAGAPAHVGLTRIDARSGADCTYATVQRIREEIARSAADAFVLLTGTDSMEEVAYLLDLVREVASRPLVVTGAMRPADADDYDGIANVRDAMAVARHPAAAGLGVLVVMNSRIHAARHVRKADSAHMWAFQSDGPIVGEVRSGRPSIQIAGLPARRPTPIPDGLGVLDGLVVPMVTVTMGFTAAQLALDRYDGLVLAGMGTGSLPTQTLDDLAEWTRRIPIAIVTRCASGQGWDDHLYKGSLTRYEDRGLQVSEHGGRNALQARVHVMLGLAAAQP